MLLGSTTRILVTGGASSNLAILQVIADVFYAPVFAIQDTANSACLGCAYRAKHGWERSNGRSFMDVVSEAPPYIKVAEPLCDAQNIYNPLTARYKELEDNIVDSSHHQVKKPRV